MPYTLVTNDDGVDSPALPPLVRALGRSQQVHVAVPAAERSWIGKAITRVGEIAVEEVERDGIPMAAVAGHPADAVQLGIHQLYEGEATMVVSGVNIGANFGSAYLSGSGTVGAALEGSVAGLPSFAFSAVSIGHFAEWAAFMRTPESVPDWERFAGVSASIVDEVMAFGFPQDVDVISVNMPADADPATPRVITAVARTRYGPLFKEKTSGVFSHDWVADMHVVDGIWGSDVQAVADGKIAITPLRIAAMGVESPELRKLWE